MGDVVGVITGTTTSHGFYMNVLDESVGKNDFVEVPHEDKSYLLIVKEVKREREKYVAYCEVVGTGPHTPFFSNTKVYRASKELVRDSLDLESPSEKSVYIGKLKDYDVDVWLPTKKLGRVFIVGKPGFGKSYTAAVLIEEFIKRNLAVVIIDTHGEYSSLRFCEENRRIQYSPYSEQITEYADLGKNPWADVDIKELKNTIPEDLVARSQCTIINLRGLETREQIEYVHFVLTSLLQAAIAKRIPSFYLVLDEAHLFAGKERQLTTTIVRRFSQEGRKFGANLVVITQRPQLLDSTVRSLTGTWIIHRLTDPNDVKIALESGGLSREWEHDLYWLNVGEAIITGEVISKIPIIVKVRRRETKHWVPELDLLEGLMPKPHEREKRKLESIWSRNVAKSPPKLAENLPQLYTTPAKQPDAVIEKIENIAPYANLAVKGVSLEYMPAILCECFVRVRRERENIEYSEVIRRLIPCHREARSINWSSISAYGLTVNEVYSLKLADSPQISANFHLPISSLFSRYELERAKEGFISYAIAKSTRVLYFHPVLSSLSAFSEEELKNIVQEKIEKLREESLSQIKSKYEAKEKVLRIKTNGLEKEKTTRKKLIEELRGELADLKELRKELEKQAKSTYRISRRIENLTLRISRLESQIAELDAKIENSKIKLKSLHSEMESEIARVESSLEQLLSMSFDKIGIQPRQDEVEISRFQLLWIPIYKATVSVENGKEIRVYWNALNERGMFGTCIICGSAIEKLEENWLCASCLNPVCNSHIHLCQKCKRGFCDIHSWKCANCGEVFCELERRKFCHTCNALLCENCSETCEICKAEFAYCSNHVISCKFCGMKICVNHREAHVSLCAICRKDICVKTASSCAVCGGALCKNCSVACKICGSTVCLRDSWKCKICDGELCKNEHKYTCVECGAEICEACSKKCKACGKTLCDEHLKTCPTCGQKVCENCLVQYSKFLVLKRTGCKVCR